MARFYPARTLKGLISLLLVSCIVILTVTLTSYKTSYNSVRQDEGDRLVATDVPPDTALVLLLSYQRSGSTYVSHVFTDHDHVFFLYEPLEALYSAMFGTQQGWNGPDDIFNHNNGMQRILPEEEFKAVTWYLNKLFTCKMAELPPSILVHKMWNGFKGSVPLTNDFAGCMTNNTDLGANWHKRNDVCRTSIRNICGTKFGDKRTEQEQICRKHLWGENLDPANYLPNAIKYSNGLLPRNISKEFRDYFECFAPFHNVSKGCAKEFYDEPCRNYKIRAIKTVRGQMDIADYFMKKYSNFKVIHSFRDPRGVTNSRSRARWALSAHGKRDKTHAARTYCNNLLRDYIIKENLEMQYPNRTRNILYDAFVRNPIKGMASVYSFLGKNYSSFVRDEFMKYEKEKKQFVKRNDKWKNSLKEEDLDIVTRECHHIMELVDFNVTLSVQ